MTLSGSQVAQRAKPAVFPLKEPDAILLRSLLLRNDLVLAPLNGRISGISPRCWGPKREGHESSQNTPPNGLAISSVIWGAVGLATTSRVMPIVNVCQGIEMKKIK